jgi:hypothetical protein
VVSLVAQRLSDAVNDGGPVLHKSGGPGGPNANNKGCKNNAAD